MLEELIEEKRSPREIRPGAAATGDAMAADAPFLDEEPLAIARRLGERLKRPTHLEEEKSEKENPHRLARLIVKKCEACCQELNDSVPMRERMPLRCRCFNGACPSSRLLSTHL